MTCRATAIVLSLAAALVGCGAPKPSPHTVAELVADPILLQGIVVRCSGDKRAAASDLECTNARLALERVGAAEEAERVGPRGAEFQRQREQRRQQEEQGRRAAERAQPGFDPYTSPVTTDKPEASAKP
jgi:hypothetical protein